MMDIYNEEDTDLAVMFEYGYEKGRASLQAENKRLRSMLVRIQTSPFIVGEFFMEDGLTPRKSILICPMEGSDALYDYVKKEKNDV